MMFPVCLCVLFLVLTRLRADAKIGNERRSSRDSSLILMKGDVQRRSDPLGRVTRLLWFNGEIGCFSRTQGHSSTDITPRPLTSISTANEETFVQRSRPPSASLL